MKGYPQHEHFLSDRKDSETAVFVATEMGETCGFLVEWNRSLKEVQKDLTAFLCSQVFLQLEQWPVGRASLELQRNFPRHHYETKTIDSA